MDVPGATFVRGAQAANADRPGFDPLATAPEGPPREVTVDGFALQRSEARVDQLRACVQSGPCAGFAHLPAADAPPTRPATWLSYDEATTLCTFLGGRLPTEDEWELAARGGHTVRFPWGDAPECPYRTPRYVQAREARLRELGASCPKLFDAMLTSNDADSMEAVADATWMLDTEVIAETCEEVRGTSRAAMVTAFVDLADDLVEEARDKGVLPPACAFEAPRSVLEGRPSEGAGFLGMAGNVAEWVDGRWSDDDDRRVLRGGSYLAVDASEWRTTARQPSNPDVHLLDVGVRCARSVSR
ncbi:MAG: SUMF1/EgtB/PvdO family nonheme iron enzyme [Alphaproteobacteria bacterium]|nr:SUMF1/EgtB/PvdO family nonheme iron enzyme [Alphaproteobacteria bacterium]